MRKTPKKGSLSYHKKKAWEAFSLLKKLEFSSDGIHVLCYTCDREVVIGTSNCQGGHLFPKKGYPAHYFAENGVRCQCYHCNISLSGNSPVFIYRIIDEIGQEAYDDLYARRHDSVKLTKSDYIEMEQKYKDRITKLKKEKGWN